MSPFSRIRPDLAPFAAFALLASVLFSSSAAAQHLDSLAAGAVVRVTTFVGRPWLFTGTLHSADSTALVVTPYGRASVRLPYSTVEKIEVSCGREKRGGAGKGAVLGFLAGFGIGVLATGISAASCYANCSDVTLPPYVFVGALSVAFIAVTTGAGAIIGSTDRTLWKQVWP